MAEITPESLVLFRELGHKSHFLSEGSSVFL